MVGVTPLVPIPGERKSGWSYGAIVVTALWTLFVPQQPGGLTHAAGSRAPPFSPLPWRKKESESWGDSLVSHASHKPQNAWGALVPITVPCA